MQAVDPVGLLQFATATEKKIVYSNRGINALHELSECERFPIKNMLKQCAGKVV